MTSRLALFAVAATLLAPGAAFAHAQLLKATPGVGTTVSAVPAITLAFSEGVAPDLCGVTLTDGAGKSVPLGRPTTGADATVLTAVVKGRLVPGAYTVTWHAVSVDTHRTQGKYGFTLQP